MKKVPPDKTVVARKGKKKPSIPAADLFKAKVAYWSKRKKKFGDRAVAHIRESRAKQAERIGEHVKRALDGKFFEHGLDYGCGYGRMIPYLLKHCGHVWAVDIMKDWVNRAGNTSKTVTAKLLNAFKLPIEDGSIDFIADIMTTQGFTSDEKKLAFAEMSRVAAPGASVLCLTKSSDGLDVISGLDWINPPTCNYVKDIDQSGDEYCLIVGSLL